MAPLVLTQLGAPQAVDLRAMQALAAALLERSTHTLDLPYRVSSFHPDQVGPGHWVETARRHAGEELVGWALWVPGVGVQETELVVHPSHAAALEPGSSPGVTRASGALATPPPVLPVGRAARPPRGTDEAPADVASHRAAFGGRHARELPAARIGPGADRKSVV
jgi:hypothetical protein